MALAIIIGTRRGSGTLRFAAQTSGEPFSEPEVGLKRSYVDTPIGQIHYAADGEGSPLVLFHPSSRSFRVYTGLIPPLAKRYRVFAPDLLDSGGSDRLPAQATMEDLALSVVQFQDALGIARADIFGLGTGNKVAAALASGWPQRVGSVILCGETHSIIVDREKRSAAIHAIMGRQIKSDETLSEEPRLLGEWASSYASLSGTWWNEKVLAARKLSPDVLRVLADRAVDFMQARDTVRGLYRANFGFDFEAALSRIKARTLVVELATEAEEHLGRQGQLVADLLADGSLVTMEDTGGDVVEWAPHRLAEVILGFLGNGSS